MSGNQEIFKLNWHLTYIMFITIVVLCLSTSIALSEGRTYKSESADNKPRLTVCRLAVRRTFDGTKYCIYRGANGTYEQHSVPAYELCAKEFQCVYRPRKAGKETMQDIIEKLERNFQ